MGMEEEEARSSVLLGRAGMNNNFKFKMNPISHDFHPQNWKQTKTTETRSPQFDAESPTEGNRRL